MKTLLGFFVFTCVFAIGRIIFASLGYGASLTFMEVISVAIPVIIASVAHDIIVGD